MATPNIPAVVAKLQAHLAALGDGRDCRSDNERATYRRAYDATQACISGLGDAPVQLARVQARIEECEAQRVAFLAKEADIERAIATAPDWTRIADTRERDKEQNRQESLTRQLELLRKGALYRAPGMTYAPLDHIEERIAELTRRRDALQSALDAHLKAAEQLLAATVVAP